MSGGRGDEVVAAAGQELHRVRLGREGAEADGEHTARGSIDINIGEIWTLYLPLASRVRAVSYYPRVGRGNSAAIVLFFVDIVNYVLLNRLKKQRSFNKHFLRSSTYIDNDNIS